MKDVLLVRIYRQIVTNSVQLEEISEHSLSTSRQVLEKCGFWDDQRRLKSLPGGRDVAIPLLRRGMEALKRDCHHAEGGTIVLDGIECKLQDFHLPSSKKNTNRSPQQVLQQSVQDFASSRGLLWTEELGADLPRSWARHGDLVLLPATCFTLDAWKQLGAGLWEVVCSAFGVSRLAKSAPVSSDSYRSPQVVLLHGSDGWVEHVDNGIRYKYDVTRCMFSAGNITEKLRVASWDCRGQTVVDLYAGIGYFTLPYLVHAAADHVFACEWNPDAVEALRRNLVANKVENRCTVCHGDNRKVCPKGVADHVNLGLIPSSEAGWPAACAALKPTTGGVLHIHANVTSCATSPSQLRDGTELRDSTEADPPITETAPGGDYSTKTVVAEGHVTEAVADCKSLDSSMCTLDSHGIQKTSSLGDVSFPQNSDVTKNTNALVKKPAVTNENIASSDLNGVATAADIPVTTSAGVNSFQQCCNHGNAGKDQQHHPGNDECKNCCRGDGNHAKCKHASEKCKIHPGPGELRHRGANKFSKRSKQKPAWKTWAGETADRIQGLLRDAHTGDWLTTVLHVEHVKSYAPHIDHLVLDLLCQPVRCTHH